MSNSQKRRQKKLERHKQRRKEKQGKPDQFTWSKVARSPFGPCWVSDALDDDDDDMPNLVHVLVSRKVSGRWVVGSALVDRTCLGVKDATVFRFDSEYDVEDLADRINDTDPLRPCEPSFAQSVVFHALDYAEGLGFSPHRDFEPRVFEPRPEMLVDTPLSSRERPFYVPGPNDRASQIIATLLSAVGKDFDYVLPEELDETEVILARALLAFAEEPEDTELPESEVEDSRSAS